MPKQLRHTNVVIGRFRTGFTAISVDTAGIAVNKTGSKMEGICKRARVAAV